MRLELDHFFILVEPGAKVAEKLTALGLQEGPPNVHPGQGTANRRFFFSNAMLELLWVHDEQEALTGPGKDLHFPERAQNPAASPFGVVLRRQDNDDLRMPFAGWTYQPEYFSKPMYFHIGANSDLLAEPLCIYMPFQDSDDQPANKSGVFQTISQVTITTPAKPLSTPISIAALADRLLVEHGTEHLMEVVFDQGQQGQKADMRPDLPLIIHW